MEKLKRLTPRQTVLMDFIVERIRGYQLPPTLREMGSSLGISSTNGVNDHLNALQKKGWIERTSGRSRGIMITEAAMVKYGLGLSDNGVSKSKLVEIQEFLERLLENVDFSACTDARSGGLLVARKVREMINGSKK